MDETEGGLNILVALAKAAYNKLVSINEDKKNATIPRIAERLHWIICRTEKWKHICSPDYNGCAHSSLKHALEYVNLVLEAASKEPESWRQKVKKVLGSTGVVEALGEAEASLNTAFQDLRVDQSVFTKTEENDDTTNKSVKEALESFASATSAADNSLTNQQEMDQSLATVMKETSEGQLSDHRPPKMETLKFECKLDEIEYDEKDILGGGVFAKVYAGTYKKKPFKKKQVAIKCLNIDAQDLDALPEKKIKQDALRVAVEAILADRCSIHPNFVQVFGFFVSFQDVSYIMERPMVIMERMHSTLFEEIHYGKNSPTFVQRLNWLQGIAQALEFLHLQGIVHHDVKSLNILLNESKTDAKLGDFGITKVQGLNATRARLSTILATSTVHGSESVPGSVAYRAPELFTLKIYGSSRVAEMYGFGVTVWECLTGYIPHMGTYESTIRHLAVKLKDWPMLRLPREMPNSDKASDLELDAWNRLHYVAGCCIKRDLSQRLTATQVVRVWSQTTFEVIPGKGPIEETPPSVPMTSESGVLPRSESSQNDDVETGMEEQLVAESPDDDSENKARRTKIVVIITVILVVFAIANAAVIAAVVGSDKYNTVNVGSNQTAPTVSPATTPGSTPLPTSSPAQSSCILSNFQLRRAVEEWSDPSLKSNVETSLGNMTDWCFGPAVTDMSNLFRYKIWFNEDVSRWDVSYVTNMKGMFQGATKFNQDLCAWGPQLQGRQVALENIFLWTGCEAENEPNTDASPPGPFCHFCK